MPRRPSPQTSSVLHAFAADPAAWRYGYELGTEVSLKAGSLYPILIRLCDLGHLEATWESEAPPGRPARHLYRLLPEGLRVARDLPAATASAARPAVAKRPVYGVVTRVSPNRPAIGART